MGDDSTQCGQEENRESEVTRTKRWKFGGAKQELRGNGVNERYEKWRGSEGK